MFYSKDHPNGLQVTYGKKNIVKDLKDFLRVNSKKYKAYFD
jgi:hypothetical protein